MPHTRQYSDTTLDEMQLLYGEGYLSPGGAEEVDAILDGVPVLSPLKISAGARRQMLRGA